MRFLALLVILLGAAIGYSYYSNPAACIQVAQDLTPKGDSSHLVRDLTSVINSDRKGSLQSLPDLNNVPVLKNIPIVTALAPAPPPPPVPVWTPPAVIPAQPNWTWTTISGEVYHNVKVFKVDPDYVTATYDEGGGRIALASLPPDLQRLFNYMPPAGTPTAVSRADLVPVSGFSKQFDGHLVSLGNGGLQKFDATSLKGVKFWAFYYSASWCPPCRAFTPTLVDFYKGFKGQHPNFELIFVNHDHNEDDMINYMKTDGMPWPAVSFDDINEVNANQYCGEGIPDLVLVDANGKVLSDSFAGSNYLGPDKVLDDIKSMVPAP